MSINISLYGNILQLSDISYLDVMGGDSKYSYVVSYIDSRLLDLSQISINEPLIEIEEAVVRFTLSASIVNPEVETLSDIQILDGNRNLLATSKLPSPYRSDLVVDKIELILNITSEYIDRISLVSNIGYVRTLESIKDTSETSATSRPISKSRVIEDTSTQYISGFRGTAIVEDTNYRRDILEIPNGTGVIREVDNELTFTTSYSHGGETLTGTNGGGVTLAGSTYPFYRVCQVDIFGNQYNFVSTEFGKHSGRDEELIINQLNLRSNQYPTYISENFVIAVDTASETILGYSRRNDKFSIAATFDIEEYHSAFEIVQVNSTLLVLSDPNTNKIWYLMSYDRRGGEFIVSQSLPDVLHKLSPLKLSNLNMSWEDMRKLNRESIVPVKGGLYYAEKGDANTKLLPIL